MPRAEYLQRDENILLIGVVQSMDAIFLLFDR